MIHIILRGAIVHDEYFFFWYFKYIVMLKHLYFYFGKILKHFDF